MKEKVLITIEKNLLKKIDNIAKSIGATRSGYIESKLRSQLEVEDE